MLINEKESCRDKETTIRQKGLWKENKVKMKALISE